jgi:hypothetical protein
VPEGRRESFRVTLTVLRLYLARQRGDLRALAEEAEQLQSGDALDVTELGFGEELRALALISLGIAELWLLRLGEAEAHLERGVALARRIGRPLLEISGLAHWGLVASFRSSGLAVERGQQAIELAQQHGWGGAPLVAIAYPMLASSCGTCTTSSAPTAAWRPSTGPALLACSRPSRTGPEASRPHPSLTRCSGRAGTNWCRRAWPGQLSRSARAAMAGPMARSRTFPKPITSAGGAAVSGLPW